MLTSVKGIYRGGRVELTEHPGPVRDETQVIVTFVETCEIDLDTRGISQAEAAELRDRLAPFADDWNSPEMEVYDDYDAAKTRLSTG